MELKRRQGLQGRGQEAMQVLFDAQGLYAKVGGAAELIRGQTAMQRRVAFVDDKLMLLARRQVPPMGRYLDPDGREAHAANPEAKLGTAEAQQAADEIAC